MFTRETGLCDRQNRSRLSAFESAGRPILLYDNDCKICSRFAQIADSLSKGWVDAIGLFTEKGRRIKAEFFRPDDRPDEMFWLLIGDMGYGGRRGLLPLAREVIRGRMR